jgi:hypothetical protein
MVVFFHEKDEEKLLFAPTKAKKCHENHLVLRVM